MPRALRPVPEHADTFRAVTPIDEDFYRRVYYPGVIGGTTCRHSEYFVTPSYCSPEELETIRNIRSEAGITTDANMFGSTETPLRREFFSMHNVDLRGSYDVAVPPRRRIRKDNIVEALPLPG